MNLLNLPNWEIATVAESDHDYRIEATYSPQPQKCPNCSSLGNRLYRHGSWEQLVMDLPCHGKRVGISLKRTRWRCQDCGKTFLQPLPDIEDGTAMTTRLVAYIQAQSLRRTFTSIADEVGVDEKTVRNVFQRHVAGLERTVTFKTPEWMGIDEVQLVRKHRCIVTNLKERTVVGLLPDRNKRTVAAYLRGLPDRDKVEMVAMDMWTPYWDAVRAHMPQAAVVIDSRATNACTEALNSIAKSIQRQGRGYRFNAIRAKLIYDPRHLKRPKYGEVALGADIGSMLGELDEARELEDQPPQSGVRR